MSSAPRTEMSDRWQGAGAGSRYRDARFASERSRQRDPQLVGAILRRLELPEGSRVLDVPCGAARMRATIDDARLAYVGADISQEMLAAAPPGGLVRADVRALPFSDASFELVLCCRLLHHVQSEVQLGELLAELFRVSGRFLAASFWDSGSLAAWRARARLARRKHPEGRIARPRREIADLVQRAGGEVLSFHHSFRFVSQQTFFLARRASDRSRPCPS
jgi:SAM-dependent methyltransferase